MAEGGAGSSRRAWEIIASYRDSVNENQPETEDDSLLTNDDIDAYLSSEPVDYSDLVNGWSAVLSPQLTNSLDDDIDDASKPLDFEPSPAVDNVTSRQYEDLRVDNERWAKNRDNVRPSAIILGTEDNSLLEYCQLELKDAAEVLQTINDELSDSYESLEIDVESQDISCQPGVNESSELCDTSNANNSNRGQNDTVDENTEAAQSADDRRVSQGAATSPREQIHVDVEDLQPAAVPEADRDVSLEAVRETLVDPQLFDNLEDEISALNANLARCQIEKSMLEEEITRNSLQQNTQHEYQVAACDNGEERWILNPASETINIKPENQTLRDQIVEFVEMTKHVISGRIAAWSDDVLDNESEDNSALCGLPDELLLHILSYIPIRTLMTVISQVCKRWYILASDPSLWRHLYVPAESSIDPHWLCYVASRCPLLKSLSIRGGYNISEATLSVITQYCHHLTSVDFGFCDVTIEMLDYLVTGCKSLHTVNFEGCECVNREWVEKLCQLKKLRSINISHSITLLDEEVIYLAENTTDLVSINIDGNSLLSDLSVVPLCMKHEKSLVYLSIDGAESTDQSIQFISRCSNLQLLTISFAESITSTSVEYITKLKQLYHLQIRKNNILSSESLCRLFTCDSLQNLHHLDLTECTQTDDSVVRLLCDRCPNLTKLILGWCWNISDVGVAYIVQTCRNLEHLDLLGLDQIEGDSFTHIPEQLPRLTLLILVQCNRIKDDLIKEMLTRMPQLTAINFYHEDFRTETMVNY